MKKFITLILLLLHTLSLSAQVSQPSEIHAHFTNTKIKLDGSFTETAWQEADKISNFTQRELHEGKSASEKTEVAILYDNNNLYIGVWAYDSRPDKLSAKEMKRDFDWKGEDNFEIILSPFADNRNGYLFVTNPNGARADVLVSNIGKGFNKDWNGIWDVAVKVTEEGWFAEYIIPFSTLKFPEKVEQIWSINFERNIRRKNEQLLWQGWSRDYAKDQISHSGKLLGLKNISSKENIEIKPFISGGVAGKTGKKTKTIGKIGGDINYLVTPTLKLNITANTDFAQVESDAQEINLTRHSLFFPEKRAFFLEGKSMFDFSLGRSTRAFYTRRIGLHEDEEVPVINGVRLIGKAGHSNIGLLSIQTAEMDSIPTTNYSVIRVNQDVFEKSNIGFITTAKNSSQGYNYLYGANSDYSTSALFGDKNFRLSAAIAQTQTKGEKNTNNTCYSVYLSYPNDFIEYDLSFTRVPKGFNPEMGFLQRENYKMISSELQINPRPEFIPWIRKMEFKPLDAKYYFSDNTNELETVEMEFRPLGFYTTSGEFIELNIQRFYDRLDEEFEISDDVIIPVDNYWYNRIEIKGYSYPARPISVGIRMNWGDFYNGTRDQYSFLTHWNLNKHLNIMANWNKNIVCLPGDHFTTAEIGGRVEYAFNPKLYTSLYGQWNNEDKEAILNYRVNWIPKIGSDFYFVINQYISTENNTIKVKDIVVMSKLVWRFGM